MSNSGLLTLGAVGVGAWYFLSKRRTPPPAPVPLGDPRLTSGVVAPPQLAQPNAATAVAGTAQLITQQRWWEKYVNGGQPAPAGAVFPQIMVPDSSGGAAIGNSQSRGTG